MRFLCSSVALAALCVGPPIPAGGGGERPPALKELSRPAASFEVPYRLTKPKHLLVRAKINGKGPFNFVLDTGAPALYVAEKVARKAGVKPDANGWAKLGRFELEGGVVLRKTPARIETPFQLKGMNGMGLAGVEVHGLIGYNVLARYRMEIDFTRDKLVWTPLDYEPKAPRGMGAKTGGGQGGLETVGLAMETVGKFLGRKATPDVQLRGFLGITVGDGDEHPVVKAVLEKGPAGEAGLRVGDTVTRIAGRGVYDAEDVYRQALKLRAGEPVKFTVLRGKETKDITVTVGGGI
jgi:hypothetical protein